MKPYKPQLTKQEIQELKYEYHYCGHSIEELAEKYQLHKSTVQYHCWPSVKARKDAYSKARYDAKSKAEINKYWKEYRKERADHMSEYFQEYNKKRKEYRDKYYYDRREHYKKIFHMNYLKRSGASCDTCLYRYDCAEFKKMSNMVQSGLSVPAGWNSPCDKFKKERKRK